MPLSAASDLILNSLPMSHKKDARLMWVNILKRETTILAINAKDRVLFLFVFFVNFFGFN